MAQGRLVTFEGTEGCGKSVQIARLAAFLTSRGQAVASTREPGGTPLGEALRDLLLDPAMPPVPLAELLMLEAARAQLVHELVKPALARGEWVLADRYADSSTAYQGAARGLGIELVEGLNRIATAATVPDRTIVLHLPVDEALRRARSRSSTTSRNRRFEDEAIAFHDAVARAYRELAAREPGRVRLVDGSGSPDDVHERVLAALVDLLP